ncbi:serine/threonine-protein phosphatase 6 regulatory subunit 3 isoform X2 [Teleopsis dalmanni]|uniref:serine/threonine-protein phosphatase 6 regulatory subunit 3 isoform X2 n=1 Tax=Teleopsis dalmanni TaxID=139649 RepID=UPI0018CE40A4|nr:serine/threonine-protein phosphatase 6 regulatory subunit 3 isoform X2 [Teleopsis dalmanni]
MFWDKGYTPSQNIELLLEKENATVEEFLDDEDILQECRTQKKGIINYFTRFDVIKRLIELITTEPSDELPMVLKYRHANMACEILTLGIPSLDEKLLSDADTLKILYSYLEKEPPLNSLLSSFFSKTFCMLFTKKAEQDWFLYQQMCLQFLEYLKSQNNFLDLICKHFTTPVIPDLILQMMRDVEGGQLKRNLYEWLTEDKLVERLIAILGNPAEVEKHYFVADFLCDLIQQGRTMRQTESENDSFEPAFSGSNPILKTIESVSTVTALLNVILEANALESTIVSGITVVLTLIKPTAFLDEPNSDRIKILHTQEKDIHDQIITTVVSVIAPRLNDFSTILRNPPKRPDIVTTAGALKPPFGNTRLQICTLFTLLLQTKNEDITKAICETDYFETLLDLFKQYCWNNFLHGEVEKCIQLIFYTNQASNTNNSTQASTVANDGSFSKNGNNGEGSSFFDFVFKTSDDIGDTKNKEAVVVNDIADKEVGACGDTNMETESDKEETKIEEKPSEENKDIEIENNDLELQPNETNDSQESEINENDTTKISLDSGPSALQLHVIHNCKIVSRLIDCWEHNRTMEASETRRRLGYMGHLIKIFKHISCYITEYEYIGALIESNLNGASEVESWKTIMYPDGDLSKALATQSKMLANCIAQESGDYSQHLPKDFLNDTSTWDFLMSSGVLNNLDSFTDNSTTFGRNIDDNDDEKNDGNEDGHPLFSSKTSTSLHARPLSYSYKNSITNPWDKIDPFTDLSGTNSCAPWNADFSSDNFADFDAHFSSFASDLGDSLIAASKESTTNIEQHKNEINEQFTSDKTENKNIEEYDNNANVEKSISLTSLAAFNKFEKDDNIKNDMTAIVQSLNSVLQGSEDDYEDDEGMWTKPLGGSAIDDDVNEKDSEGITANGPNIGQLSANENSDKLCNSIINSTPATAVVEKSNLNELNTEDDKGMEIDIEIDGRKENVTVTTNKEILSNVLNTEKVTETNITIPNAIGSTSTTS